MFYAARRPCGCVIWGTSDLDYAKYGSTPPKPEVEIVPMTYEDFKAVLTTCRHGEVLIQGVLTWT